MFFNFPKLEIQINLLRILIHFKWVFALLTKLFAKRWIFVNFHRSKNCRVLNTWHQNTESDPHQLLWTWSRSNRLTKFEPSSILPHVLAISSPTIQQKTINFVRKEIFPNFEVFPMTMLKSIRYFGKFKLSSFLTCKHIKKISV